MGCGIFEISLIAGSVLETARWAARRVHCRNKLTIILCKHFRDWKVPVRVVGTGRPSPIEGKGSTETVSRRRLVTAKRASWTAALWNAKPDHLPWVEGVFKRFAGPYYATEPVLTEVAHLTGRNKLIVEASPVL